MKLCGCVTFCSSDTGFICRSLTFVLTLSVNPFQRKLLNWHPRCTKRAWYELGWSRSFTCTLSAFFSANSGNDNIIIYVPFLCCIWQQLPCLNIDIHNSDIFSLVRTTKWATVQIVIASYLGWYKPSAISELIAPETSHQSAKPFSPFTCLLPEPEKQFYWIQCSFCLCLLSSCSSYDIMTTKIIRLV